MRITRLFLLLVMVLAASNAFASGAQDLLKSVGATNPDAAKAAIQDVPDFSGVDVKIPIHREIFLGLRDPGLDYESRRWFSFFLKKDYKAYTHLRSAMTDHVTGTAVALSRAAYIYSLSEVGAEQIFTETWVDELANEEFLKTPGALALDETLRDGLEARLIKASPYLDPSRQAILDKLPAERLSYVYLKAYASIRNGLKGLDLVAQLSPKSPLKVPIAKTLSLALAKKGELAKAARIMTDHLEPALDAQGGGDDLAEHYLEIARLLYQVGQLEGAEDYYSRIPGKSRHFLTAREELMWVLLRKGDSQRMRGEVEALKSYVYSEHFHPEAWVVFAISSLKLCFYEDVQAAIDGFQKNHRPWAKRIDEAMKAAEIPEPASLDRHSAMAKAHLDRLEAERKLVAQLAVDSVAAALPAVGVQKHWTDAEKSIVMAAEAGKKSLAQEYSRQWKASHVALSEAIRKMRFVRLEFMNQVRKLAKAGALSGSKVAGDFRATKPADVGSADGQLVFPFDGIAWPDEFFKLRSLAQSQCSGSANVALGGK